MSAQKYFGCYLLKSLSISKYYVGFTTNPMRRIRQHNREIKGGAKKTKSGEPWEMLAFVYGFPDKIAALQFEWAWQHPTKSKRVRASLLASSMASTSKIGNMTSAKLRLRGISGQFVLLHELLNVSPWSQLPLTLHILEAVNLQHCASCRALPPHINTTTGPLTSLPHYQRATDAELDKLESAADQSSGVSHVGAVAAFASSWLDDDSDAEQDFDFDSDMIQDDANDQFEQSGHGDEDDIIPGAAPCSQSSQSSQSSECCICIASNEFFQKLIRFSCLRCHTSVHLVCAAIQMLQSTNSTQLIPDVAAAVVCSQCHHVDKWINCTQRATQTGKHQSDSFNFLSSQPPFSKIKSLSSGAKSSSSNSTKPTSNSEVLQQIQNLSIQPPSNPSKSIGSSSVRSFIAPIAEIPINESLEMPLSERLKLRGQAINSKLLS